VSNEDQQALRFAGTLGHTFAVVVEYGDGTVSLGHETCDRKRIDASEWPAAKRVQVYRRGKSKRWVRDLRLR
jgi:hypothetical protein